jgi:hypothetical protein
MNTRPVFYAAVAAVAFSAAATAQEATSDAWMRIASPQSRAQVEAERLVPRPGGRMADYYFSDLIVPTKTRAQVLDELEGARHSGELAAINAEVFEPSKAHARRVAELQCRPPLQLCSSGGGCRPSGECQEVQDATRVPR